jgi:hypothetical protein
VSFRLLYLIFIRLAGLSCSAAHRRPRTDAQATPASPAHRDLREWTAHCHNPADVLTENSLSSLTCWNAGNVINFGVRLGRCGDHSADLCTTSLRPGAGYRSTSGLSLGIAASCSWWLLAVDICSGALEGALAGPVSGRECPRLTDRSNTQRARPDSLIFPCS